MELLDILNNLLNNLLTLLGTWGALLGCIFILFESIIPILPLSLFITINFIEFGTILGFIISWFFTVCGCMLSYFIFKKSIKQDYLNKLKQTKGVNKIINIIETISFKNLVLILAIPFTPAFAVNIAAGLVKMPTKKYLYALMLGKISLCYFWGYIGVGLIESLTNPRILIKISIILIIVYIISSILAKKLKIK